MAFIESPAEKAKRFREQQAGMAQAPRPAAAPPPALAAPRPVALTANPAANPAGALPAIADWAMNRPEPKGFTPTMPSYTAPNPTNKPVMLANPPIATPAAKPATKPAAPVIASPGASATQARQSPGSVPTQSPASPPTGAGASSAAGGAAPKPYTLRPDGVAVVKVSNGSNAYGATGASVANAQGRIGSVNTQNFGNPVVPQGPGAIARPGVASTFGLGVNDPRLNDQRVESVNIQRPGNLTFNPAGNAETFNARQDREGRQATNSAIDLALFQARGKPGAEAAISDLLQTQARLNSGAEGLSQEAIQNRANRDNAYGIADLNNAGENNRAGIQADVARAGQQVAREGQQLTYQSSMADIARPQLRQDANGNFVNIAGNTGTPVVDANGKPVRGQQAQADAGQITPALQLQAINKELASLAGNPPVGDDPAYAQRVQELRAQQSALLNGGGQAAATDPYRDGAIINGPNGRMRYNAKTNAFEPVK